MMRWARITAGTAALAAVIVAAAPGRAQAPAAPASAGGGIFRSNGGPIDIGSDHGAEQFQGEGRIVWRGNVDVVQGDARLRTPELTIFSAKKAGAPAGPGAEAGVGNIERVEATGPLYYVTPTQQVKGDHGTYLASNDTITVTGDVTLLQGQDVLHGDKLVIEQKTGHSTLTTSGAGKGGQRVRAVFFPKDANAPGAPASAAPAKPAPAVAPAKPGA